MDIPPDAYDASQRARLTHFNDNVHHLTGLPADVELLEVSLASVPQAIDLQHQTPLCSKSSRVLRTSKLLGKGLIDHIIWSR